MKRFPMFVLLPLVAFLCSAVLFVVLVPSAEMQVVILPFSITTIAFILIGFFAGIKMEYHKRFPRTQLDNKKTHEN